VRIHSLIKSTIATVRISRNRICCGLSPNTKRSSVKWIGEAEKLLELLRGKLKSRGDCRV
jgi:hypothetical protein